ncbi:MAG: hypothetical protein U0166_06830 [Acidobacteriota bacterium]
MAALSRERELAFRAVAVALPFLGFALVEAALRLFLPAPASDPYLNLTTPMSVFSEVVENGQKYYKVTHPQAYNSRDVKFLQEKPPGTYRIFCLGESACAGWPHPPEEIWSEYLKQALEGAYPGRSIEVLNVSAHGFAAYRLRLIFNDLMHLSPDLVILWIGNNEFLERRTYFGSSKLRSFLFATGGKLRTVQLARGWLDRKLHPGNTLAGRTRGDTRFERFSKVSRLALDLRQDPAQFAAVKEHYAFCMDQMLVDAARRRVPVVAMTVPVNLRDWIPNVSVNGAVGEELEAFRASYASGMRALEAGDAPGAEASLGAAVEKDPAHAEAHFHLGQAFERLGCFSDAHAQYVMAKDLDANPFRAVSSLNDIVREHARRYPTAMLLDMEREMELACPTGAPGFDMFVDYVHPSKEGNLLIARKTFELIRDRCGLGTPASRDFAAAPSRYQEYRDAELQRTLLWLFGMMHQDESVIGKAASVLSIRPKSTVAILTLRAITPYASVRRQETLGETIDPATRQQVLDAYDRFYQEHYVEGDRPEDQGEAPASAPSRVASVSVPDVPPPGAPARSRE